MAKTVEENERIKRKYLGYLAGPKGRNEKTINKVAAAIARFEKSTNHKPFKKFHVEQGTKFRLYLVACKNPRTKKPLSHATIDAELRMVKNFIFWLAGQAGYKSRISYSDADYFNNKRIDARIAHTHRPMPYPTTAQCERAFDGMPERDCYDLRDKAFFSFLMLAGSRIKAASTLRLKHINLDEGFVFHDAREVETKFGKSGVSVFYPVDQIYYDYFERWVRHLYDIELFGPEDPLFPKTKTGYVKGKGLDKLGLSRDPYTSTSQLYQVIKDAFSNVQLPAYSPHNFRRTHGSLFSQFCKTPDQIKAWSENFTHSDIMTTINDYVPVSEERRRDIIKEMRSLRLEKDEEPT